MCPFLLTTKLKGKMHRLFSFLFILQFLAIGQGLLGQNPRKSSPIKLSNGILFSPRQNLTRFTGNTFLNQKKIDGIRMNSIGNILPFEINKEELASTLRLPLRDLRIIDPSYPSQAQAAILTRPGVILISMGNLKIIIKEKEVFIFNHNHEQVRKFTALLERQFTRTLDQDPNFDLYPLSTFPNQSFEHTILEACFHLTITSLADVLHELEPDVSFVLSDLRSISRGLDVVQTQVDKLLPLKNQLDEFQNGCQEIRRCFHDILHSDDELAMLSLCAKPASAAGALSRHNRNHHTEHRSAIISIELLLENYFNEIEWILSEVDNILDEVKNTEENMVLQLDLIRNRILKFELFLSISTFVISVGSLITGLFGMNLLNHYEHHYNMFYFLSLTIFSGMMGMFYYFLIFAKKEKLL
jgi:magnesium transporter